MKIKNNFAFIQMLAYIKDDYSLSPESWLVRDILSSITMPESFLDSDSPTTDPAYWYDWKELVEEEVAKDKTILDDENGLTLEQGLVAMQYFLEQKYWVKDNDMLLKDAYADLIREYDANKDNLASSQLWQEWLAAVAEGKKFDKVFQGDN